MSTLPKGGLSMPSTLLSRHCPRSLRRRSFSAKISRPGLTAKSGDEVIKLGIGEVL